MQNERRVDAFLGVVMSYQVDFTIDAQKVLAKYKKSDPIAFKKLTKLLLEISEHPRTGTGHPEPLKGGNAITYSRRISGSDRIIYDIYEEEVVVLVLTIGGHYGDK